MITIGRSVLSRALLVSLLFVLGGTVSAQTAPSPYEFREILLNYNSALASCGNPRNPQNTALQRDINALTDEQLLTLYDGVSNWGGLMQGVNTVVQQCASSQDQSSRNNFDAIQLGAVSGLSFNPDYPSGPNYDTFIATLPGLGLLDNGKTNRSDANGVAGAWIAIEVLRAAAIVAEGVCNSAPSGDIVATNVVLCPPAAIAFGLVLATEITLDQTGFQDELIDSAEIEATFENTKVLLNNTLDTFNALEQHDSDISAQISSHDTNISNQISQHDADISDQINQHDTDISNQIDQHDEDISSQLTQHDNDIKARLDLLNGKIDVLLERQLEIVRLLTTPEGRRTTDIPACSGGPCSFPEK